MVRRIDRNVLMRFWCRDPIPRKEARRIHSHRGRPYCVIGIYLDAEVFARIRRGFARRR